MTVGTKIKNLRKRYDLSQAKLAELIGSSVPAVTRWESDKSFPATEYLINLSRVFSVSADYLLGLSEEDKNPETRKLIQMFSYLDKDQRDMVMNVVSNLYRINRERNKLKPTIEDILTKDYIKQLVFKHNDINPNIHDYTFKMVQVNNDVPDNAEFIASFFDRSMEPDFVTGSVIYFESQSDMKSGDVGLFQYGQEVFFKLYLKVKDGSIVLCSINPEYKDTNVTIPPSKTKDLIVLGKAITKRKTPIPAYVYKD